MKNKILQLFSLLIISIFFVSCSKCVECSDCADGVTLDQTEFCEDDFDSKEDYDLAVDLVEALGCECK